MSCVQSLATLCGCVIVAAMVGDNVAEAQASRGPRAVRITEAFYSHRADGGSVEHQAGVEIGLMRRTSQRSAVGATLLIGSVMGDPAVAPKGRYRRYLADGRTSLEGAAGPVLGSSGVVGVTSHFGVNLNSLVGLAVHLDLRPSPFRQDTRFGVGVRLGGTAGIVAGTTMSLLTLLYYVHCRNTPCD